MIRLGSDMETTRTVCETKRNKSTRKKPRCNLMRCSANPFIRLLSVSVSVVCPLLSLTVQSLPLRRFHPFGCVSCSVLCRSHTSSLNACSMHCIHRITSVHAFIRPFRSFIHNFMHSYVCAFREVFFFSVPFFAAHCIVSRSLMCSVY
jgi:hypothetical protein